VTIYLIGNDDSLAALRGLLDNGYALPPGDAQRLFRANDECLKLLYETHLRLRKEFRAEATS